MFPAAAAETVLARTGWKDLSARLDAAAEAQYQALLEETDYRARAAQVEFTGQALDTTPDEMTYAQRAGLVPGRQGSRRTAITSPSGPLRQTTPISSTPASGPPVPRTNPPSPICTSASQTAPWRISPCPPAPPQTPPASEDILLSGDTLTYAVTFPEPQTDERSDALLHLQGTYRYTVDLQARTVSLRLENN